MGNIYAKLLCVLSGFSFTNVHELFVELLATNSWSPAETYLESCPSHISALTFC